jgi:hypothetical protein
MIKPCGVLVYSVLLVKFSGLTFENPTDSTAWPNSVPFGWSVEWDPSSAGSDPPSFGLSVVSTFAMCVVACLFFFHCEPGQAV